MIDASNIIACCYYGNVIDVVGCVYIQEITFLGYLRLAISRLAFNYDFPILFDSHFLLFSYHRQ